MTPAFDPDVTEYSVSTTNATNTVTATAAYEDATIQILNGETPVNNGSAATWSDGVNILTIKVINGTVEKTYTVTVTKA